mgnify:CR=1 FL=1
MAGLPERIVVSGHRDAVFLQQGLVKQDAVHLAANRKPVYRAVPVGITAQIGRMEWSPPMKIIGNKEMERL